MGRLRERVFHVFLPTCAVRLGASFWDRSLVAVVYVPENIKQSFVTKLGCYYDFLLGISTTAVLLLFGHLVCTRSVDRL